LPELHEHATLHTSIDWLGPALRSSEPTLVPVQISSLTRVTPVPRLVAHGGT
jgi:hypothetical protein